MDEDDAWFFFHGLLEQEREDMGAAAGASVEVKGAANVNARPISDYEVRCAYGDIVLMVCVLKDYLRLLEGKEGPMWDWYKNKFAGMADSLAIQIDYDYEEKKKKCEKKMQKMEDSSSDVGEDAMVIAMKRRQRPKGEQEGAEK